MKIANLVYITASYTRAEFQVNQAGEITTFKVNGIDLSNDGKSLDIAIQMIEMSGRNLQADISLAFERPSLAMEVQL